jgi:hypothetical protein
VKSGAAPEWVFVCGTQNGLLTLLHENKPVVLLFTTPPVAKDYLLATRTPGEVRQFRVDSLPATAQTWLSQGIERIALNRCPRCTAFNMFPMQNLIDGNFPEIWSWVRAMQWLAGEAKVRELLEHMANDRSRARAALERIRDHIAPDVPWVFEFIAFFARGDNDEEAKLAAMERLKDFGPEFADWPARWSTSSQPIPMATAFAKATVGLCQSFGIPLAPKPSM